MDWLDHYQNALNVNPDIIVTYHQQSSVDNV